MTVQNKEPGSCSRAAVGAQAAEQGEPVADVYNCGQLRWIPDDSKPNCPDGTLLYTAPPAGGEVLAAISEKDGRLVVKARIGEYQALKQAWRLAEALRAFMALDKTFSEASDRQLEEIVAEGGGAAPMARAVLLARHALRAAHQPPQWRPSEEVRNALGRADYLRDRPGDCQTLAGEIYRLTGGGGHD